MARQGKRKIQSEGQNENKTSEKMKGRKYARQTSTFTRI
jgi:hypothetical protein